MNDVPRTIVGIMPPRFAHPTSQVELWLPLALDPMRTHPATFNLVGIGRLARGVSTEAGLFLVRAERDARSTPHPRRLRRELDTRAPCDRRPPSRGVLRAQ